jgi:hypothetical protein
MGAHDARAAIFTDSAAPTHPARARTGVNDRTTALVT